MKRRVRISELKAKLSEHLRYVKRGHTIEVLDRDVPVAQIRPVDEIADGLQIRPGRGRLRDVKLPPPLDPIVDAVGLLRKDRDDR